MKNFSVISLLFLLLFSGCHIDYVSRSDSTKVYATGTACGAAGEKSETDAVNELVKEYPLIADDLRHYSKVRKTEINGTVCYDAVVTKRTWDRYERVLQERKEAIIAYADRNEKVFEYNNKRSLVKTMLREREKFNERLESAKRVAPMNIEPFEADYKDLAASTNVLPSVTLKVHPCNRNRNYNCNLSFVADAKDESRDLTYMWDFGDGSKSEIRNPKHIYNTEGAYRVTLLVTDPSNLSTFRTTDIEVTKNKVTKKRAKFKRPKAYFLVKQKSYKPNEPVDFDNRSTSYNSKIKSYLWQFGDGTTSTERNPQHKYAKTGRYVVKYKMCDSNKNCAYASTRVKVAEASKKRTVSKKKAESVKKTKTPVVKTKKGVSTDAKAGESIQAYIARHGQPSKQIIKKKGTTKAYKFGKIWLLVKYDKVVCAVEEDGFKTTLMGQPKKCNWHKRYAKDYMVELQD